MDDPIMTFPQARMSDLVMKEMPDEVLIYDLKQHKAHCLNQTAALIWRFCDGKTSIPLLAQTLSQQLQTPLSEEVVWVALQQLSRAQLLEQNLAKPGILAGVSRRQALRQLTWGAILAPLVTSIIAPTAQAANTCVGQSCTSNAQCACTSCCNTIIGQCAVSTLQDGDPCSVNCQCLSGDCSGMPKICNSSTP